MSKVKYPPFKNRFIASALMSMHCTRNLRRKVSGSATIIFNMFFPGVYFCYDKYEELESKGVDDGIEWKFTTNLDSFTNSKKFWLAAGKSCVYSQSSDENVVLLFMIILNLHSSTTSGIILTVVFVVLFLIILVLRKRINLAIALIKEASRFVTKSFCCHLWKIWCST